MASGISVKGICNRRYLATIFVGSPILFHVELESLASILRCTTSATETPAYTQRFNVTLATRRRHAKTQAYNNLVATRQPESALERDRQWRSTSRFAGLALCVLAVVFALGAKLDWYQSGHSSHGQLASMKALRANPPALPTPSVVAPLTRVILPALCLLLVLLTAMVQTSAPGVVVSGRTRPPFHRSTIARPPPTR